MSYMREGDTFESYMEYRWSMISMVHVNFEGPEATVVTKDAKATLTDKIGECLQAAVLFQNRPKTLVLIQLLWV
jgi:hypothetical protein